MSDVENKVIFTPGGSSGIRETTAELLAQNGAKVIGARRVDLLETIVKEIHAADGTAEYQTLM